MVDYLPAPDGAPSTMHRDVASAYAASAARIISWIVTSAAVYRIAGAGAFAILSLVRATIGILNYASVGLAPAMIRLLAEAKASRSPGSGFRSAH